MQYAWGEDKYIQNSVGKSEGQIQLGRPSRSWEDNIKVDLK
jgi:hypothetical protein